MKKFSAILVALVMMLALCIPAFAGEAVDALTDTGAKAFCDAAVEYIAQQGNINLNNEPAMVEVAAAAAKAVSNEDIDTAEKRAEIASLSAAALAADYNVDEQYVAVLETKIQDALAKQYTNSDSDLGFTVFDPEDVVNNVAGEFTENDLSGLFDTMRNTITDLSDRLSNVFSGLGGGTGNGNDGTNDNSGDGNTNNGTDNSFGASEPTGDTAIYAVAGVAAVAAAALVLTKKKSASK